MPMRRFIVLALVCIAVLCACLGPAAAGDSLDWQRNGFAVASDGQDTFVLTADGVQWHLHTAQRLLNGEPPLYTLPEGAEPFGLLYADAASVWYARYSATHRYTEDGQLFAALEFVRYDRGSGAETVVVSDANPSTLFLRDGRTLSFLPFGDASSLATVDFAAQTDTLTLKIDDSIIWDVTQLDDALYLLLYNDESGLEMLYRVTDEGSEKLPEPEPRPDVSWFQGRYRAYYTAEDVYYAAPLSAPTEAHPLAERDEEDIYFFGDYRWICDVDVGNVAALYRLPLSEEEPTYYLEFDALPQPFVHGITNGAELTTLDRRGRILHVDASFTALTQLAQTDYTTLFSEGQWVYALPFPQYIVLLGYSEAYLPSEGLGLAFDMVRIVRMGEGMTPKVPDWLKLRGLPE